MWIFGAHEVKTESIAYEGNSSGFSGLGDFSVKFFILIQDSYVSDVHLYYSKECWMNF